ncbi:adenosylmethionine--8-amino-7-oxononanoate transaminase [Pseudomarimonas salicorniae]|uniref:Adenosylmethionine-8-amino-7-oxononanoate aminotransferase n=1 Tax=Pseudomarimonas salicorniae TaxID=2933270 RepID=A0ABT0GDZ9_9GAMM|nr:adenosylmethionine--8-amino-7-oxononanoate transaminase [Lysobacter sp. CAU 1642]MCK7592776.1 adenosylmethionine--8-amino-7-oxononanoate transaminase [Lysobacter sp. CAU 1642]
MDAAAWRERDLRVLWHPCTQMQEHHEGSPLIPIRRGEGVWLEGYDGRRYLDAVSSWWTNLFGHAEPRIAAAIAEQAARLEQVILAGFSHAPAIELAEALLQRAPPGLDKVFYADNGSAAVEVALKMSFHAHRNGGDERRTRFLALSNSYHGETLGALAVTDIPLYRRTYAPLMMKPHFVPSPDAWYRAAGEDEEACALRAAAALGATLEDMGEEISALIVEPLVQCAGGMRMHHPAYLREARRLCAAHGVHLIADEIAVGFGRTGTLFACEQAGITPDFLCLSKGITGGFLPLAAVLTGDAVYERFLDDSRERAFLHSHSYTGNPIACAAALASLSIFDSDEVLERNRERASLMAEAAEPLAALPGVAEVRQCGMILAVEMARSDRSPHPAEQRRGRRAYVHALEQGVLLRPLGDVLYWMPPYCIDVEGIARLGEVTASAILHVAGDDDA